jgi:rhodanese-related sulfurtransferase
METFTVAALIALAKTEIDECDLSEVEKAIESNSHLIIDVREPEEFTLGHIGNAINIPRGVLEFRTDTNYPGAVKSLSDKTAKIILYCRSGGRSALAAQSLAKMGYKSVVSMSGGFMAWEEAKRPVSSS